jgi:hypothetical protein
MLKRSFPHHGSIQRRGLAASLLAGWMAFWLIMTPLCCSGFDVPELNAEPGVLSIASVATMHGGVPDHDNYCQSASSSPIVTDGTASSFGGSQLSIALAVAETSVLVQADAVVSPARPLPPPSGLPNYLRHQRLLI